MSNNQFLESETLELKIELPSTEKLAIEMIALANLKGGQIIIGYDEKKGKVVGCDITQKLEELISNVVMDLTTPRIEYTLSYETVDDKTLVIIHVHSSSFKPHYLKNRDLFSGTYVRIGSTSRLADRETVARLIREGKNVSYDLEVLSKPLRLEEDLLKNYVDKRFEVVGQKKVSMTAGTLEDLGLQRGDKTTVAGALLFTKNPQQIPELSNAYIKIARLKKDKMGNFLDRRDIFGPLAQQIEDAVSFILRHTATAGEVRGLTRHEQTQYPIEILREIVTNAVIHRDYSISGSTIRISVFDDQIEVLSPGGLPTVITLENMAERQYSRNPILAKRLFEMGYFDGWGQGIDKILDWSKRERLDPPEFQDQNGQFSITIFSSKIDEDNTNKEVDRRVLDLFKSNPSLTNRLIQKKLKLTKTQVQVILRRLLSTDKIVSFGKGRSIGYRLKA